MDICGTFQVWDAEMSQGLKSLAIFLCSIILGMTPDSCLSCRDSSHGAQKATIDNREK